MVCLLLINSSSLCAAAATSTSSTIPFSVSSDVVTTKADFTGKLSFISVGILPASTTITDESSQALTLQQNPDTAKKQFQPYGATGHQNVQEVDYKQFQASVISAGDPERYCEEFDYCWVEMSLTMLQL